MAEFEIVARYRSWPAHMMLAVLMITLPIWGILAPFVMVAGLVSLLHNPSTFVMGPLTQIAQYVGGILGLAMMSVVGVLLTLSFADDRLLASRVGLRIPFFLSWSAWFQRSFPWADVKSIELIGDPDKKLSSLKLLLTSNKGRLVLLSLGALKESDVEQLLLASELWCGSAAKDGRLQELHKRLQAHQPDNHLLSYTAMWEEELDRRFTSTAFMPLEPGLALRNGSLKVLRQLSFGGLSAVYLCQSNDKELVVLKESVIPPDSKPEVKQKAEELFAREAKFLMKLDHPDIVRVFDYFVENKRNYMLLEYINGQDLRQFVRQNGPQRERTVLGWAAQICAILGYLHGQEPPVIHRDLTPDNLVLKDSGRLTLIDFGAANEFIGTATGTLVGKQAFISPEQLRGKPTVQSDIYGLGCTMHFLLTGEDPEPLSESRPKDLIESVSDETNRLVTACTALDAETRPASAAELERQIEALLARHAPGAITSA